MYFCVYMFCFISMINIFVAFFTIVIRYLLNKKKCIGNFLKNFLEIVLIFKLIATTVEIHFILHVVNGIQLVFCIINE